MFSNENTERRWYEQEKEKQFEHFMMPEQESEQQSFRQN